MSNILEKYEVSFSTSIEYGTHNRIRTNDELLTQFIGDHYRIIDVKGLLGGINQIAEGVEIKNEGYTQSLIIAVVTSTIVKIYENLDEYENDNFITPGFTIPFLDFKAIVEAWYQYLILH